MYIYISTHAYICLCIVNRQIEIYMIFLTEFYSLFYHDLVKSLGLHWGPSSKESACNAGDPGLIPGLGRSPGEENGYPL